MRFDNEIEMIFTMRRMERRFKRVCRQLVLMNNNIRAVKARYDRAVKVDRKTIRYNLRLRILSMEGVRNMFWDYAETRADQLDEMEKELKDRYGINWDDVSDEAMAQEMSE